MGSNSASAPAVQAAFEAASSSEDVASNELVRLTSGECGAEVPARPVRFRGTLAGSVGVVVIMFCGRGRG